MFRNASKEKKFTRNRTPAIKWQKKMLNFLRVLALKLIIDAIFLFKKKIKGSEKKENFFVFLTIYLQPLKYFVYHVVIRIIRLKL